MSHNRKSIGVATSSQPLHRRLVEPNAAPQSWLIAEATQVHVVETAAVAVRCWDPPKEVPATPTVPALPPTAHQVLGAGRGHLLHRLRDGDVGDVECGLQAVQPSAALVRGPPGPQKLHQEREVAEDLLFG